MYRRILTTTAVIVIILLITTVPAAADTSADLNVPWTKSMTGSPMDETNLSDLSRLQEGMLQTIPLCISLMPNSMRCTSSSAVRQNILPLPCGTCPVDLLTRPDPKTSSPISAISLLSDSRAIAETAGSGRRQVRWKSNMRSGAG